MNSDIWYCHYCGTVKVLSQNGNYPYTLTDIYIFRWGLIHVHKNWDHLCSPVSVIFFFFPNLGTVFWLGVILQNKSIIIILPVVFIIEFQDITLLQALQLAHKAVIYHWFDKNYECLQKLTHSFRHVVCWCWDPNFSETNVTFPDSFLFSTVCGQK